MKFIRQSHFDAVAANGTPPIQLTTSWEDNCLRLDTGAVVRPEHRDDEQQVRTVKGTPHTAIKPHLNRASEAALFALEDAHRGCNIKSLDALTRRDFGVVQ